MFKKYDIVQYTNIEFLNAISIFNINSYWFVRCYIIMYMISPFVNKFIEKSDRLALKKLIILLIVVFCIVPYVTFGLAWDGASYTVEQFILIYFIGAYIRKYQIDKQILKEINVSKKRAVYITIFLLGFVINCLINLASNYLSQLDSNIFNFIANQMKRLLSSYTNPILLMQTIAIFLLFGTFNIKSRFINYVSGLTLGVYIFHDNPYIRGQIYKFLRLDLGKVIYSKSYVTHVIITALIIFVIGLVIEVVRKNVVKLLCKIKVINRIDSKIMNCINNITEIKG